MCVLVWGKYPHPQTIVPGGISTTITTQTFNEYQIRLFELMDHAKRMVTIWEDISGFLYAANSGFEQVGARPRNLIDLGIWDHHEHYDATYANSAAWGEQRWATPGVMIDGELVTTNLHHINLGLEEFVEHAYYEPWADGTPTYRTDPLGNPISPHHPWNKRTIPKPEGRSWKERYTWSTSPRWDREVVEAGAYARMWMTATARKLPANPFIESTGTSLKMTLPKGTRPEMTLEWVVPQQCNAIERNRARAYAQAYTALVCLNNLLAGYDLMKKGETRVSTPFTVPRDPRIGVGFWGAGRGYLAHHLTMDNGVLTNYQICTPSTTNAGPKDPFGKPGPYEEAVVNTPILERFDRPEDFKAIDILRTIRSFDPCMPCTTHVYAGRHTVVREVNTCACILDEVPVAP
jgi:hydrogenase large subunit